MSKENQKKKTSSLPDDVIRKVLVMVQEYGSISVDLSAARVLQHVDDMTTHRLALKLKLKEIASALTSGQVESA